MSTLDMQHDDRSVGTMCGHATVGMATDRDVCFDSSVQREHELIRVMHVINGEHYAGAERVQDLLASSLPAEGFQVGFACVKTNHFPQLRACQQVPLFDLAMRRRFDLSAAWKLAQIVADQRYRIIHAHTPRSAMVARLAAAISGIPMVYHVHSPATRDSTRRLANWINAQVERWSVRGAGRLIAVSKSLAESMRKDGFPAHQIAVVHNGVPATSSLPNREAPQSHWTVGTIALFRPRKGTELLLDAIALMRSGGVDVRLRAVGCFETTAYESQLKQRAERLGVSSFVEWTGFRADVHAEFSKMDLMALPSLFGEGLPMVVLEAMSAGVPVVATRVEGVPEAIRDGVDGVIARPGDADDLARAISRVVDGQVNWASLRSSAFARQAGQFSDQSMAAGVGRVYRELLSG